MKHPTEILSRVETELSVGRVWRAKEILSGNIKSGLVVPEILERYGVLLDSVGDRLEAGKYLYLSGIRRPEYEYPIALFLQRHSKLDGPALVSRLPQAIRRTPFNELPAAVQADLDARGVRHSAFGVGERPRVVPEHRWTDHLLMVGAVIVMLFFFASLAVGGWKVTEWVWGVFD
jgi:hypothetical protein